MKFEILVAVFNLWKILPRWHSLCWCLHAWPTEPLRGLEWSPWISPPNPEMKWNKGPTFVSSVSKLDKKTLQGRLRHSFTNTHSNDERQDLRIFEFDYLRQLRNDWTFLSYLIRWDESKSTGTEKTMADSVVAQKKLQLMKAKLLAEKLLRIFYSQDSIRNLTSLYVL